MSNQTNERYKKFDELTGRHQRLIRKLCWSHSSEDPTECKDLVQECYVSIWSHLPSLRRGASALEEAAWVCWQCRSVLSHNARRKSIKPPFISHHGIPPADTRSDEHRELIEELSAGLSPYERQFIELSLEGYSVKEIAEKLDIKYENAKKRLQRIVKKMRKMYEKRCSDNSVSGWLDKNIIKKRKENL